MSKATIIDEQKLREAFEAWAQQILGDNPTWRESGPCELAWRAWCAAIEADRVSRDVFSATQQVAKPVPRFPFCERKDPHAREMQPVQAQPDGSGGFGQKLFPEVSAFCPKLFPQATGFDEQPKPANQQKE